MALTCNCRKPNGKHASACGVNRIPTPWGISQSQHRIADGINQVTTAGHGGMILSAKRQAAVTERFPNFQPWAGEPYYEEDCDVSIVVLTFPELFSDAELRAAVQTVRWAVKDDDETRVRWTPIDRWLDLTILGGQILAKVKDFEQKNAANWEVGGMSSSGGQPGWSVNFTRIGDGAKKRVMFTKYPEQQFYTESELGKLIAEYYS
jgi:hypothetical protein